MIQLNEKSLSFGKILNNQHFCFIFFSFFFHFSFSRTIAVNDKLVISRSCYWEHMDAHKNDCLNNNTPSYIKTEFCETCSTDGCNGATQYGPVALLVAIPVAVAKILLL